LRQGNRSGPVWTVTSPYGPDPSGAARLVGRLTAILSIGAGIVHVSAAADHTDLPVMLAGFLVVATLQVALGALLLWRRPSGLLIVAALGLMLGSVGVWLISRTLGLPFLPGGHMEPIGFKDGVTVLFELGTVPALLLLLSRDLPRVSLPSPRLGTQSLAVVGAGAFALLMPALVLGGGTHHSHEQAVAMGIHEHDDGHGEDDGHVDGEQLAQADAADGHSDDHDGAGHDDTAGGHDAGAMDSALSGGGGHEHSGNDLAGTLGGGGTFAGGGGSLDTGHAHGETDAGLGGDSHDDGTREHAGGDGHGDAGQDRGRHTDGGHGGKGRADDGHGGGQGDSHPDSGHPGGDPSGGGHGEGGHGDGSEGGGDEPIALTYS
jgi:hypothetical protein